MENTMGMKQKTAFLGAVTAALLATTSAWANGVGPAFGPLVPSPLFISENDWEQRITGLGQSFEGVGVVNNISRDGSTGFTYTNVGNLFTNGVGISINSVPFLYAEFSGF